MLNQVKNTIGQNKNSNGYIFSSDNYKAGYCGSGYSLKSDIPQGDPKYDAARKNMGEPWVMPTDTQGQELIDNTNSVWTTINKVNGRKFISNSDTYKYIFLPAAGMWQNHTHSNYSSSGYYWATICISSMRWYLYFTSDRNQMTYRYPEIGHSIRGVRPIEW